METAIFQEYRSTQAAEIDKLEKNLEGLQNAIAEIEHKVTI